MSSSSEGQYRFKVVLLGEGAVGKSSLMLRYVENKFSPRHLSTVQASFQTKQLEVDGNRIELNIWDTAGQEKYHALGPIYYRGSDGALLIYDITDRKSFDKVKMWIKELQRALGENVSLMIVGNKLDLEKNRTVDSDEAKEYAATVGAQYEEASAKENLGIAGVFETLIRDMIVRQDAAKRVNGLDRDALSGGRGGRRIELVDDPPSNKRSCCK